MRLQKAHFLYLAIAIPLVMLLSTLIGVFLYHVDLEPQYDFVYAIFSNYDSNLCEQNLTAELTSKIPGTTVKMKPLAAKNVCKNLKLYLYKSASDRVIELSELQADNYLISKPSSPTSPDGFRINEYCNSKSTVGWWGDLNLRQLCLEKGEAQKRLNIQGLTQPTYKSRFFFIGWVLRPKYKG